MPAGHSRASRGTLRLAASEHHVAVRLNCLPHTRDIKQSVPVGRVGALAGVREVESGTAAWPMSLDMVNVWYWVCQEYTKKLPKKNHFLVSSQDL
jgi:hypothetical protein